MLTTAEELNLRFVGDGVVYAPQHKCPHAPRGTPPKLRIDRKRAERKAVARAHLRDAVRAEQIEAATRMEDITGAPPGTFDSRFGCLQYRRP